MQTGTMPGGLSRKTTGEPGVPLKSYGIEDQSLETSPERIKVLEKQRDAAHELERTPVYEWH